MIYTIVVIGHCDLVEDVGFSIGGEISMEDKGDTASSCQLFIAFLIDLNNGISCFFEEPVDHGIFAPLASVVHFLSFVEEEESWEPSHLVFTGCFFLNCGINFGHPNWDRR